MRAVDAETPTDESLEDMRYWLKGLEKIRYVCSSSGGSHAPKATRARGYVTVKCSNCGFTMVMHHSVFEQQVREQRSGKR